MKASDNERPVGEERHRRGLHRMGWYWNNKDEEPYGPYRGYKFAVHCKASRQALGVGQGTSRFQTVSIDAIFCRFLVFENHVFF